MAIVPEISPCRYEGGLKNLGAQYMRGICESNPQAPDGKMWLTYSVNKEDIWVCEVPVPIRGVQEEDVREDFSDLSAWNLYIPQWTNAEKAEEGLRLSDRDPYDRPRAQRAIVPAALCEVKTSLKAENLREGTGMIVEAQDRHGKQALRLMFDADGMLRVKTGGAPREWTEYPTGTWIDVTLRLDCVKGSAHATLSWEGKQAEREFNFNQPLEQVERILFTTKATLPWQTFEDCGKGGMLKDLPEDKPRKETAYTIGRFESKTIAAE